MRAIHLSAEQEPRCAAAGAQGAGSEPELTQLARLAARVLRAPMAVIAVTKGDEQRLIAWPGFAAALAPMVEILMRELRTAELSLLELDPWQLPAAYTCRFAAGMLLGDAETGVLCVFDHQRRRLSAAERHDLADLAALATSQLELRREAAIRRASEATAVADLDR